MYRMFFHNLYVGAKADPMKTNHHPREVAKLVAGLTNGSLRARRNTCAALRLGHGLLNAASFDVLDRDFGRRTARCRVAP